MVKLATKHSAAEPQPKVERFCFRKMCWLSKTCTSEEEQKRHARVYRETREPYCGSVVRVRPVGVSRNPPIDQLGRGDEPLSTRQRCAAERLWHACGTSEPAPEASFTGGSRVHGPPRSSICPRREQARKRSLAGSHCKTTSRVG